MTTLKYLLVVFGISLLGALVSEANGVDALAVDDDCHKVEVIFARGSGQQHNQENLDANIFFTQIRQRTINNTLTPHTYELGGEKYGNYQYPAVAVAEWSILNGIGATLSSGNYFIYGESVRQGVNELQTYITQRHAKCIGTKTRYILGGYSQGAQVVGQALPGILKAIRDDIVYVGLFGDPKLHYPEGEGWNPPACRGERSVWRKVPIFNCDHDDGSLVARRPYLPDDMKNKTGLWCYKEDWVCDPGAINQFSGHEAYKNKGQAIDHATQIAVTRLQARLKQDNPPSPPPLPWEPTPEPPVNYDQALNTQRIFNQGTTGENVVFAVDVSESMRHKLPAIEQHMRDTIPKIIARGGKVAAAVYQGVDDGNGNIYTVGGGIPFDDTQRILDNLHTAMQPNGQFPGSPLVVFNAAFNELRWTPGATKSIIAFSNNPLLSPDAHGFTLEAIASRALEIDPVNVYPVIPEEFKDSYVGIAEKTSGQVITYTDDITSAANQAFNKITNRPVPFLSNIEYTAEPGQEVTFDASDSYVIDSTITKYDWDYNGDGQFEASSSTPSVKHTYHTPFTGYMQVRVSAGNGTIANMSAKITIGPIAPPLVVPAPQNLTYTITNTIDNKSTVILNWQAEPGAEAWLVRFNDMPMGNVEASRTSLEITDIERTSDVVIGIANANSANNKINASEFSNVTIPAIKTNPPPPIISTCNQSNIFIQLLCKAIAIVKVYIQGFWYYILPYKL